MTHVGDGSPPRRSVGGMLYGRAGDRVWVGEYERGWRASCAGSWIDGFFDSEQTARRALDLSAKELKGLYPIWTTYGENRPVTSADIDVVESQRKFAPALAFWCGVVSSVAAAGAAVMLAITPSVPFDLGGLGAGIILMFVVVPAFGRYHYEIRLHATRGQPLKEGSVTRQALNPGTAVALARRGNIPAPIAIILVVLSLTSLTMALVLAGWYIFS